MTATAAPLPIDGGLLARFRAAGAQIAWRDAPATPATAKRRRARIAHLNEEEARVEAWGRAPRGGVAVESGPLGALVILLEADRRRRPPVLGAHEAGREPSFPSGALVAAWDGSPVPADAAPRLADLVELARYALA